MLSERSLIDPKETLLIQWLKKVGVDDFTLRPMLCLGFLAVGIYEHHRWYSVPSADRYKYGDFPPGFEDEIVATVKRVGILKPTGCCNAMTYTQTPTSTSTGRTRRPWPRRPSTTTPPYLC